MPSTKKAAKKASAEVKAAGRVAAPAPTPALLPAPAPAASAPAAPPPLSPDMSAAELMASLATATFEQVKEHLFHAKEQRDEECDKELSGQGGDSEPWEVLVNTICTEAVRRETEKRKA